MSKDRELLFSEFFNQKLKERGLNLKQLSEASGISMKYIESFAHGRFENLPPTPYLRGYFMRLGGILGFDAEEWWQRVREEDLVMAAGKRDRLPRNRYSLRKNRRVAVGAAVVILVLAYFGFRAAKILGTPNLEITEPQAASVETRDSRITIAGHAENADEVTVNGEPVPLEDDGFRKEVALQPGLNPIEVRARKLLGREASVDIQVFYLASPVDAIAPEETATSSATSTVE